MEDLIIENNIVKGCKEKYIVQINIPAGVKAVGDNAFRGLQKLYDINFPKSLVHIGSGAFEDCPSLTGIRLSDVSYIGERAFMNCTGLKEVDLSDKISYLCNNTFTGCQSLEKICLPKSVSYIGCECFKDCTSLSGLEMIGIMEIDNNAFENCRELHDIFLPKSLIHIGPNAFSFCGSLGTVTFFNRFTDIDETAFENTVRKIFKAVQFSTAYHFSKDKEDIVFTPAILNKDGMMINSEDLLKLQKSGIMFMSKPADVPEKTMIVFDVSQKKYIMSIIGGDINGK